MVKSRIEEKKEGNYTKTLAKIQVTEISQIYYNFYNNNNNNFI